jgi:hypothetical protein
LAKARIFLRSADVQGALCLRVELTIERIPKLELW